MDSTAIPLIDIAPWFSGDEAAKTSVARAFGDACEKWGFAIISGHGLDRDVMARMRAITKEFLALPVAAKERCSASSHAGGRGFFRLEAKSNARTLGDKEAPGDLKETFYVGPEPVAGEAYTSSPQAAPYFVANVWPDELAQMPLIWGEYMKACQQLSADLLRISARALDLPDDWFEDKIWRPISSLTAQYYPPQVSTPLPGQLRSGAHTDFGTLTLLWAEDRPGGLQVRSLDGRWTDVKPIPDTFIVNLGDMMAQWTNDRWRSTLHRVVNPPADAASAAERLSIVYFHTPNYDALIECIPTCATVEGGAKYAPVLAGDHLMDKLRKTNSSPTVAA